MQRDYVGVFELFQERRLSDGREGRSLFLLKPDLLQRHHLIRQAGRKR